MIITVSVLVIKVRGSILQPLMLEYYIIDPYYIKLFSYWKTGKQQAFTEH